MDVQQEQDTFYFSSFSSCDDTVILFVFIQWRLVFRRWLQNPKWDQYSSQELTKLKLYSFSATVHTFHLHTAKPASQRKHSQKQPCSSESPWGSLVLNKKPCPREYICNEPLSVALASDCTNAPSGSYESHKDSYRCTQTASPQREIVLLYPQMCPLNHTEMILRACVMCSLIG